MRAALSFVQAWLIGIGVFTAMTAAFCVAMIIAISGPPTDEELSGVRATSAEALRSLSAALARAGEDLCESIPGTVAADEFCPPADGAQTAAEAAAVVTAPSTQALPAAIVVPVSDVATVPVEPGPNLLGAPNGAYATAQPPARARVARSSSRHARVRRHHPQPQIRPAHTRRTPAPQRPVAHVTTPAAETLPAPSTATLVEVQAAPDREIAADGPTQDRAPSYEQPDKKAEF